MVNEVNKPQSNDALTERLAASNRQLREMQEEHRQLLAEMEVLRERATELTRLNAHRQELQQHQQLEQSSHQEQHSSSESSVTMSGRYQESKTVTMQSEAVASSTSTSTSSSSTKSLMEQKSASTASTSVAATETQSIGSASDESFSNAQHKLACLQQSLDLDLGTFDEDDEATDAESAEYIKGKIAEIAALKAQYKRVQHMVNTTNLIEQHLSTKSTEISESSVEEMQAIAKNTNAMLASSASTATSSSEASDQQALLPSVGAATQVAQTDGAKEELLSAMLNMFTDFSDDLRGQAESLRTERERIRTLKEELMVRRRTEATTTTTTTTEEEK